MMNNEEKFNLGFFKNIALNNVNFEEGEDLGKEKLKQIINLVNDNRKKFENDIIFACHNKIDFGYTFGSNEKDDEFFEETLKPYLIIPTSREEYQNNIDKVNKNNYSEEMKEIIDYEKLFSNMSVSISVGDEFIVEISDSWLFDDPISIVFDYTLSVEDVWE